MSYCVKCGYSLVAGNRFCGRCGQAVLPQAPVVPPPTLPQASPAPLPMPALPQASPAPPPIPPAGRQISPPEGKHMPFLVSFSCFLLIVLGVSLVLLLTLGLPRTLSDEELTALGIDCQSQFMTIAEFFEEAELVVDNSASIARWHCDYRGSTYNAYPTSSYKQVFQGILFWTCLKSLVLQDENELGRLQSAERTLGEHVFQAGQYAFQPTNNDDAQRLRQLFAENDLPILEVDLEIECAGLIAGIPRGGSVAIFQPAYEWFIIDWADGSSGM